MVASPIRLALLAVAAAATLANAAELTEFPVDYDALAYTLEFDVEVIYELASDNAKLTTLLDAFITEFDESVASGELTYTGYSETVSQFYKKVDVIAPKFSDKAIDEISTRWEQSNFLFLNDLHTATWDLLLYGVTTAAEDINGDISAQIEKLDTYMTKAAASSTNADTEKLNEQLASFYAAVAEVAPKFQEQVEKIIFEKIGEVENENETPETGNEASGSDTPTPSTTPEPTSETKNEDETPSPAPTTSTEVETTSAPTTAVPSSQTTSTPTPTATAKSGAATLTIAASVLVAASSSLFL